MLVTTSPNEDILRYQRLFLLQVPSHLPFRKTNVSYVSRGQALCRREKYFFSTHFVLFKYLSYILSFIYAKSGYYVLQSINYNSRIGFSQAFLRVQSNSVDDGTSVESIFNRSIVLFLHRSLSSPRVKASLKLINSARNFSQHAYICIYIYIHCYAKSR